MNISLNDKYLDLFNVNGKKLSLTEILTCLIVINGEHPNDIMNSLLEKGIIIQDVYNKDIYYVHSNYQLLIKKFLLQSDKNVPEITELDELVNKLQELFPKERKLDSHGQPRYSYRGNKRDVTERLQKFFKLYGKYSYDDVLECTKRYVERFKYDKTNMRLLPYFIMKTVDGELVSDLATELENMDNEDSTIITENNDWTNTLL